MTPDEPTEPTEPRVSLPLDVYQALIAALTPRPFSEVGGLLVVDRAAGVVGIVGAQPV